ncbi:hypothetical protein [Luteimonas aquatica]|uniref:hypothetical protein n=1 Tax=Luteimonas aquatica TaxID=450364 RepID=UPI001F593F47|nr:hypothetical protein [Luteimonas aquatica]
MATSVPAEHAPGCDPALRARLAALLEADAVDAALDAGLMRHVPCPACEAADVRAAQESARIVEECRRLSGAWAARERHRAREARLRRREAERAAKLAPAIDAQARSSSLPSAAAAALARAKAKAAGRP